MRFEPTIKVHLGCHSRPKKLFNAISSLSIPENSELIPILLGLIKHYKFQLFNRIKQGVYAFLRIFAFFDELGLSCMQLLIKRMGPLKALAKCCC